jgi:hypothetical protein
MDSKIVSSVWAPLMSISASMDTSVLERIHTSSHFVLVPCCRIAFTVFPPTVAGCWLGCSVFDGSGGLPFEPLDEA